MIIDKLVVVIIKLKWFIENIVIIVIKHLKRK